jgi:hypothetical protein
MSVNEFGGPDPPRLSVDGKWVLFGTELAWARKHIVSVKIEQSAYIYESKTHCSGLYHIRVTNTAGDRAYGHQDYLPEIQRQFWMIMGTTPSPPRTAASAAAP